jgi:hypothetical protein
MLDEARRLEILAALGVDVYVLRDAPPPAPPALAVPDEPARQLSPPRLVVACAPAARIEWQPRCTQLVRALGLAQDAVTFLSAGAAVAPPVPEAPAYLMLGAEAARACSAQLPLARQQSAAIAVVDDSAVRARDGAGKRALWSALKPLARRLRAGVA